MLLLKHKTILGVYRDVHIITSSRKDQPNVGILFSPPIYSYQLSTAQQNSEKRIHNPEPGFFQPNTEVHNVVDIPFQKTVYGEAIVLSQAYHAPVNCP